MHEKYRAQQPISAVPVLHPVIFYDNCDCTFNYLTDGLGADWSAAYENAAAHSGMKGIRLTTKTTTPTSADWVEIEKALWAPPTSKLTLQLLFKNTVEIDRFKLIVGLRRYDRTNLAEALLSIESFTPSPWYKSGDISWVMIPELKFCDIAERWNHLSLACDFKRGAYQFVTINNTVWDGRTTPIRTTPDASAPHLRIHLRLYTTVSAIASMDFDHILLTGDNP